MCVLMYLFICICVKVDTLKPQEPLIVDIQQQDNKPIIGKQQLREEI